MNGKIFSKRNIFLGIIAVVLILAGYLFLPVFHAKDIIILGNTDISAEDLPDYTQADFEKNIYLVSKKQIKEDFLQNPYIRSIEVRTQFPRTLILNITERKAVATVKFTGGFAIIDDKGAVLETTQDIARIVKPVIQGIEPTEVVIGKSLDPNGSLELGIRIIANIQSAKLLNNISLVDISDLENIYMITPHGITVLIGNGEDLNEKMLVLNKILINLFERKIYTGYVDMRFDSYPVYRAEM